MGDGASVSGVLAARRGAADTPGSASLTMENTMAVWPYSTAQWQRLRLSHLAIEPACRQCRAEGSLTLANTVDHVVAISAGGDPFPGHDGLQSLCASCHGWKTSAGLEAGAVRSTKPRRGCDADGRPIDPRHPWNHGKSLGAETAGPAVETNSQLISGFG